MTAHEAMQELDELLSHVWMVRTFLKHSEEAAEDEDVRDVHRALYDYALALGAPLKAGDAKTYLKTASKKLSKLKKAVALFREIQPEVSTHTNFQMAAISLRKSVTGIETVLAQFSASSKPDGK